MTEQLNTFEKNNIQSYPEIMGQAIHFHNEKVEQS